MVGRQNTHAFSQSTTPCIQEQMVSLWPSDRVLEATVIALGSPSLSAVVSLVER